MKRLLPMLMIFALLLCGCQSGNVAVETNAPTLPLLTEPTEAPQEETEGPTQSPYPTYQQQTMVAVSMPLVREFAQKEDTVVFRHSYQTMQLTVQDPDVANSITLDYLRRMEAVHSAAAEYSNTALATHPGSDAEPFFYDVYYSPTRIDQGVLSLAGVSTVYVDGQPGQTGSAANYNMLTGEVLTLGSILQDASAKEALIQLVIAQADAAKQEIGLFDDYADCITERFGREESFDEDWYFTDTGLAFYFSTYEIAPYNAGIVTLEVPYAALTGVIADEFFPPEEEALTGALQAHLLGEVDLSAYSQIAELVLDAEGEKFLIYADGGVQNLQITLGAWDEGGTVFTPACTVLACAALTPGDAVMVQTLVPDTMPTLQLRYECDGQTTVRYLTQSGEAGAVILVEG